jgi:flagellar motor switch protein FliG
VKTPRTYRAAAVSFERLMQESEQLETELTQQATELAEKTIGHDRYERLRKLNPRQFQEIYSRALSGVNFDRLVDEIPS